jgi:Lrp/AsnC family transcriptional regulator for asnA, asnC and gidA
MAADDLLDPTDRAIISFLQENSRITNTEIAKRLGVSEGTIRNRMRKLIDNDVIRNIAVINPDTLGYEIHVIIGIDVDYTKVKKVAEQLKDKEPIHFLGYSSGRYDMMAIAFFRNAEQQLAFYTEELAAIDGIVRFESFTVLKMLKTKYLWGVYLTGA